MFRLLVLLAFIFLWPFWTVRGSLSPQSLAFVVAPHRYSLLIWEVRQLSTAVPNLLRSLVGIEAGNNESVKEVVRSYFGLDSGVDASFRPLPKDQRKAMERELTSSIAQTIEEERLASHIGLPSWGMNVVFPPVFFVLDSLPHLLIISPRERIKLEKTYFLSSDLQIGQMEEVETQVARLGLSGLVERIGGVATYPSLVPETDSLEQMVETAAHEWVHHFLVFHPLGQRYWQSEEMTTINETVASMVGEELARKTLERRYGIEVPEKAKEADAVEKPGRFSFSREMRQIRQTVDDYLARGAVDEAEAYMRQKQHYLAKNGFFIRKLNQAYFAFYGTYAESPASVSPVAEQLRTVRERSPSLREFVYRVSHITTPMELARLAEAQR